VTKGYNINTRSSVTFTLITSYNTYE